MRVSACATKGHGKHYTKELAFLSVERFNAAYSNGAGGGGKLIKCGLYSYGAHQARESGHKILIML